MLNILKGHKTIDKVVRSYDLKQNEIQHWVHPFVEFVKQSLKVNPKNVEAIYENGVIE